MTNDEEINAIVRLTAGYMAGNPLVTPHHAAKMGAEAFLQIVRDYEVTARDGIPEHPLARNREGGSLRARGAGTDQYQP